MLSWGAASLAGAFARASPAARARGTSGCRAVLAGSTADHGVTPAPYFCEVSFLTFSLFMILCILDISKLKNFAPEIEVIPFS